MNSYTAPMYLKRLISAACIGAVLSAPAFAQSDDADIAAYESLLAEISNLQVTTDRNSVYVSTQQSVIDGLQTQIDGVEETKSAILPMIDKMVVAIEEQIKMDVPFKQGERYARLDSLKETIANPEATPADKMRKALGIYDIEVNYGQSLEAYDGDGPENAGRRRQACAENVESSTCAFTKELQEKIDDGTSFENLLPTIFDGTYLRYGRLSLAYVSADGNEALRYNNEEKTWDELPATRALEVRRGIRIARGESAPGVVSAPVIVAN